MATHRELFVWRLGLEEGVVAGTPTSIQPQERPHPLLSCLSSLQPPFSRKNLLRDLAYPGRPLHYFPYSLFQ